MNEYRMPNAVLLRERKLGVLVADDEPDIREVLGLGLQREGFSVWLAADGREALDLYRDHADSIDAALLDVRMPVLDGPATMTALLELSPGIPCCFMSGNLGTYTDMGLRHMGARAVLRKPFRLSEVAQWLRYVIGLACGRDGVVCVPPSGRANAAAGHAVVQGTGSRNRSSGGEARA